MTQINYDPKTGKVSLLDSLTNKVLAEDYIVKGLTEEEFLDRCVKAMEDM